MDGVEYDIKKDIRMWKDSVTNIWHFEIYSQDFSDIFGKENRLVNTETNNYIKFFSLTPAIRSFETMTIYDKNDNVIGSILGRIRFVFKINVVRVMVGPK